MYSAEALNTVILLCSPHHHLSPELFSSCKSATTLEDSLKVSYNVKHEFTLWPRNSTPRESEMKWEMKTYVQTKTCIQMIRAVLVIMAKMCKQSKCPSTCECINKICFISMNIKYNRILLAIK